jgi:hypothetical protein
MHLLPGRATLIRHSFLLFGSSGFWHLHIPVVYEACHTVCIAPVLCCLFHSLIPSPRFSVYLYVSAFLAFLASILDLVPILALAHSESNAGQLLPTASFETISILQETALSISIGFRFLYFWTFVAQPIKGERLSEPGTTGDLFKLKEQGHSASWGRWGIPGLILKWTLLTLTVTIPATQIVWRNLPQTRNPLYFAESSLEVVVSALFIVKMGLNSLLSRKTWKQIILFYVSPLFALGITLGLGLTNVILREFVCTNAT